MGSYTVNSSGAKQYPMDEIKDENDRIAQGWLTVETGDSQDEIIPLDELKKVMNTFMSRGGVVTDNHTNRVIGKVLNWKTATNEEANKEGILVDYQIYDKYSIDDDVWNEIKSGVRTGLSFGGRATGKPKLIKEGDKIVRKLSGIEAYEVASVPNPSNPYAKNTYVNFLAKSGTEGFTPEQIAEGIRNELEHLGSVDFDMNKITVIVIGHLKEDGNYYNKELPPRGTGRLNGNADPQQTGTPRTDEERSERHEIQKPFAGYKDFADCVRQNKDKEDPEAYCAVIMRKVEGETKKDDAETENTNKAYKQSNENSNKENGGESMTIKKEETPAIEPKLPEEEKKPAEVDVQEPTVSIEERLNALEEKLSKLYDMMAGEKAKEVVPKADAEMTNKPEDDKIHLVEKALKENNELMKSLKGLLEKKGTKEIMKAETPRPEMKVIDNQTQGVEKEDFVMKSMKEVREGKKTLADRNREARNLFRAQYEDGLRKVLGK